MKRVKLNKNEVTALSDTFTRGKEAIFPLAELEVNESLQFDNKQEYQRAQRCAAQYSVNHKDSGVKFMTRWVKESSAGYVVRVK